MTGNTRGRTEEKRLSSIPVRTSFIDASANFGVEANAEVVFHQKSSIREEGESCLRHHKRTRFLVLVYRWPYTSKQHFCKVRKKACTGYEQREGAGEGAISCVTKKKTSMPNAGTKKGYGNVQRRGCCLREERGIGAYRGSGSNE
jgi:hypothetical protein